VTFPHSSFNTPPFRAYNVIVDRDGVKSSFGVTVEDNIYKGSKWTLELDEVWPKAIPRGEFQAPARHGQLLQVG
jgi:hypothetical protein